MIWRLVRRPDLLRQNATAEYPLDVARQGPTTVPASARLELAEETQVVLHGLRQLPLLQRQVLALIYDEFSYAEIAQIMGMSQAAVRKNAERARRRMSELLPRSHLAAREPASPAYSRADVPASARPGN